MPICTERQIEIFWSRRRCQLPVALQHSAVQPKAQLSSATISRHNSHYYLAPASTRSRGLPLLLKWRRHLPQAGRQPQIPGVRLCWDLLHVFLDKISAKRNRQLTAMGATPYNTTQCLKSGWITNIIIVYPTKFLQELHGVRLLALIFHWMYGGRVKGFLWTAVFIYLVHSL